MPLIGIMLSPIWLLEKDIHFIEMHDLIDIWRNFHKTQRQYTLARLDRFYGFSHQLHIFLDLFVYLSLSDHSLVHYFFNFGIIYIYIYIYIQYLTGVHPSHF